MTIRSSEGVAEIATALCAAQGEMENAAKNVDNPYFHSRYANLAEVLNTIRPVLSKHGLSLLQAPSYGNGTVDVETMLLHKSGQFFSSTCSAPVQKNDPQGVGSAITYLRRYSASAIVGIAQEDDDGNAASETADDHTRPVAVYDPGKAGSFPPDAAADEATKWRKQIRADQKRMNVPDSALKSYSDEVLPGVGWARMTANQAKEMHEWMMANFTQERQPGEEG